MNKKEYLETRREYETKLSGIDYEMSLLKNKLRVLETKRNEMCIELEDLDIDHGFDEPVQELIGNN